jgi:putative endonuclease
VSLRGAQRRSNLALCHCEERSDEAISPCGTVYAFERLSMRRQYYVYILTNKLNTVLYTGITGDLQKRIYEHKSKVVDGFTKKYNVNKLVYYEVFDYVNDAIAREKQIKSGSRQRKMDLIQRMNPRWSDLYNRL